MFLSAQSEVGREIESVRVFRSNSLGMPVEEISSYRRDEFDFILERKESTGRSITTLYFQGKETALWERS